MPDDKSSNNRLPNGKPHVSYSEQSTWMQCSWRHKLKYVDKIELDSWGTQTILGTVFHAAAEEKVNKREPVRADLLQLAKDELEKVTKEDEKAKFDVEACVSRALVMVEEAMTFLDTTLPGWKLIGTELALYESMVLEGLDHKDNFFKGFVDLVVEAPDKRGQPLVWIIDWKTSGRPWGREKLSDPKVTYQLSLYKNFCSKKLGVSMDRLRCAYAVGLTGGKPGKVFSFHQVSVGPTTSKRTLTVLNNFVHSMKNGVALKKKSEQNCKWCEYRGTKFCP